MIRHWLEEKKFHEEYQVVACIADAILAANPNKTSIKLFYVEMIYLRK